MVLVLVHMRKGFSEPTLICLMTKVFKSALLEDIFRNK